MDVFSVLLDKLLVMFLFMIIGIALYRKKLVSEEGSRSLANILIHLVLPCVILNSFLMERNTERIQGLFVSTIVSIICLLLSILIARFIFLNDPIGHFAAAFANPGFFGIPLIIATLGEEKVFYVAPFIACLNILQWTYGVAVLKRDRISMNTKMIVRSPFMISFIVGIILFLIQFPTPNIYRTVIKSTANLNTPIAMIVSGIYLSRVNLKEMIIRRQIYKISCVRILLIPAVSCMLLWLIPKEFQDIKMSLFLAVACPVGSNVAVYSKIHGKDYGYAVETVVLSTILSMITIPIWVLIIQWLW